MITGRTLDEEGRPIDGTGFEVGSDGELARFLAERTGPISSHPTRPAWAVPLESPDGEAIRSLSVFGSGYGGPPEHYHEHSREVFEVREGTVTFTIDGEDRPVAAGKTLTVDPGQRHTFRVDGDDPCHVITEIHDPGRLRYVLPTLGGIAHDPAVDDDNLLQRVMIARRLDGNTVFTDPDPRVARPLARALEPLARLRGYEGAYGRYLQPGFWEAHVEQPDPAP